MGGVRVVVFKNTFKKEGSKEPDYKLYFAEQQKKNEPPKEEKGNTESFKDDIPF